MSLRYLLDSNILSEPIKKFPNSSVMQKLVIHQQEIATATLVLHELLYGCYRLPLSNKRQMIESYIEQEVVTKVPLLPYDMKAARYHAVERSRLVTRGKTPPFADGQIAAIARVNDLILVTNNTLAL
ncbi:type II toxin-antitoxin system VapC family toxin [Halothece sp. PCC 7418]|uniref:type II toxin-antitoxin system VapC family toxin n=1 Tax=Halothece sp. (strain PCC 7418) TaxID=65093 RepID=UPI000687EEA6|nr:type II toxin-antitoxin system VapC family toxin [Halothece sp. PCC 7418]